MDSAFLTEDFLLHNDVARTLYHEHAANMPIYDYHCHLPPDEIAADRKFDNLTQVWLDGDHYKWRAMRTNGIEERFITGDASAEEKFQAWARTVPATLRNPLYHWTHLELRKPFGISDLLNESSASDIYSRCGEMLQQDEFSTRGILEQMNVRLVCTTDDPVDSLEHHIQMNDDTFATRVYPAWRPDKGMGAERAADFNAWVDRLETASGIEIRDFDSYMEALQNRHDFFHETGCRIADFGVNEPYAADYNSSEIASIFDTMRAGQDPAPADLLKFRSCMLYEFAVMNHKRDWTQQYHLGALRNNNSRLLGDLGPDTGFDSIGDYSMGTALSRVLDRLDSGNQLTRTILYNLNPRDNALFATMIGNFQDGSIPGKMQWGSGWWFMDQKDGMIDQLNALSNMGLLSRFVGMLTDSRSFLSYPRHEYFRRILCALLGEDVVRGELPADMELLGQLVEDVCWNNAVSYFGLETANG